MFLNIEVGDGEFVMKRKIWIWHNVYLAIARIVSVEATAKEAS